jgi:hypothetical protein
VTAVKHPDTIPRCVLCRAFWQPESVGYYRHDGRVYCADERACRHRRDVAAELDRLASRRRAA